MTAPPEQQRNLFVTGIPNDFTEATLRDLFAEFGEIESIKIIVDSTTGRNRGFGFVMFTDVENATTAKERVIEKEPRLHVDFARHSANDIVTKSTKVFIRNIPVDVQKKTAKTHFSQFGEVVNVSLRQEESRGLQSALVVYEDVESAQKCIASCDGTCPFGSHVPLLGKFADDADMAHRRYQRTHQKMAKNGTAPPAAQPMFTPPPMLVNPGGPLPMLQPQPTFVQSQPQLMAMQGHPQMVAPPQIHTHHQPASAPSSMMFTGQPQVILLNSQGQPLSVSQYSQQGFPPQQGVPVSSMSLSTDSLQQALQMQNATVQASPAPHQRPVMMVTDPLALSQSNSMHGGMVQTLNGQPIQFVTAGHGQPQHQQQMQPPMQQVQHVQMAAPQMQQQMPQQLS